MRKASLPKGKKELSSLIAVSKKAGMAIVDYQMIQEGDKIGVAVSGGKDSLSLLHVLRHRQRISPVNFSFTAVHIDFGFPDFDLQKLLTYFEREGFPYLVKKVDFFKDENYNEIDCFWCSRNRRKALFELVNKEGFAKLAFGHHLDDIAETIILNQFYRGEVSAMKPKQDLFAGKVTIIRPLAYVREEKMVELAKQLEIHGMEPRCTYEAKSHRKKIKNMLREFEKESPFIVRNIFKSLQNIKSDYLIEAPHGKD